MKYPGGKNGGGAYQKIICQIPPHDVYIEPFLGSGAVLLNKKKARLDIGIDIDPAVIETCGFRSVPGFVAKTGCGISFLESYCWEGREFVYCDPPYLIETRRQSRPIYLHELPREDHERLLSVIKNVPAPVAISGYYSGLYATELRDWRYITYQAVTRGGSIATEYLWMNYPAPVELHDYGYLGENRTDRQRIKRKIARWERKLANMPTLERQALLSALQKARAEE
jgi:site-specific DNA-adenine methylase